jgi:VWFA-related protein
MIYFKLDRLRFAALGLALCISVCPVRAQQSDPADVIKVDSNLVSVPVIVSDRNGHYVAKLSADRFKLYDNSLLQKISFFDNAEEPLNVALLLDTSRSTQGVIDDIRKAARNFLKDLGPQDRAMIVSFDYAVHRLSALTNDRKVLENAIKQAQVGEYLGTTLNDAVSEIAEKDFKPVKGRKAIILLTDGQDHGSQISESELLASESESDAMVYSIFYASAGPRDFRNRRFPGGRGGGGRGGRGGGIFGGRARGSDQFPGQGRGRPGDDPRGNQRRERKDEMDELGAAFLAKLSEVTAGRFYRSNKTDLKTTFALIAEELRFQYRLGFQPDELQKDGSVHQLSVKVNASDVPDVVVRARRQYRAAERKP